MLVLTLRESAVVDILGKFLTPALFAGLLILIIYGVVNPAGEISAESMMDNVIVSGINAGYQTMDVLAADDLRDHNSEDGYRKRLHREPYKIQDGPATPAS